MYCVNCGKELADDVKTCPYCGAEIGNEAIQEYDPMEDLMGFDEEPVFTEAPIAQPTQTSTENVQTGSNGFAIAGFVCAFFVPILGIIFSAIGMSRSKKMNKKGLGLAVAGLVIAIVSMLINFILVGSLISELLEEIFEYEEYYGPNYYY